MRQGQYIVSARDLTRDYGGFRAVDDVEFSIRPGECFGFLGPNGAGKTTVMRMVHCFIPPTSGALEVFGLPVPGNESAIKARTGVAPQDENLDIDLDVMENLLVYARYFGLTGERRRERAELMLDFAGLRAKAGVNVRQLSGGMKRRLLIARALLNEPELLILDEPTTGLDPHSRAEIWETMQRLTYEGVTLILSTHYMEEAERLCDRVAIMDTGRIVAIDSPANLMQLHGGSLESVYLRLTGRPLE